MSDTINVIGVNADGSADLLGTTGLTPAMKRADIAREQFGPLTPDESGNYADLCLWALEQYHGWLESEGWQTPTAGQATEDVARAVELERDRWKNACLSVSRDLRNHEMVRMGATKVLMRGLDSLAEDPRA